MKRLILLIPVFTSLWLSCEDHRMDGLEPDKVYLAKRGLVIESVYNIGEIVTANFWTYKSGYLGTSCTINYEIDEAILNTFNSENGTNYTLLPGNCYTLGETSFTISGKEMHAPFSFTYDPALIVEAAGGAYESNNFVLPIRIIPEGVEITNENLAGDNADQVIVVFNIKRPELNILRDDFEALAITAGETGAVGYKFEIGMPFISKWDVSFGFSSEPEALENALNVYNTEHGVNYELLSDEAYDFLTDDMTIPVGKSDLQVDFMIDREKVDLGNFVLPLILTDVSFPIYAGSDSLIFLPVRCVANKIIPTVDWMVTASTYNKQGVASLPEYLIDGIEGDVNKYWHVVWKGQNGGLKDPDPWVMIDMKENRTIYQVEVFPRCPGTPGFSGINNIDGYEIFTSTTGEEGSWTGHGYHDASSPTDKSRKQFLFDLITPTTTRFVKIKITNNSANDNTVGLFEIYLRGY